MLTHIYVETSSSNQVKGLNPRDKRWAMGGKSGCPWLATISGCEYYTAPLFLPLILGRAADPAEKPRFGGLEWPRGEQSTFVSALDLLPSVLSPGTPVAL